MRSLGIYIHIPFCIRKCVYCDFLSAPAEKGRQREYVEALKRELALEAAAYCDFRVETVFFGGGTPSILDAEDIAECMGLLRAQYCITEGAEISMEANPGAVTKEKLGKLRQMGINRLSIGLQSANNSELQMLGRIHTYEDFVQTFQWARAAGFDNINVDLMSALPGQRFEAWQETLNKTLVLSPEHISAYSLIIEEGTPLYERLGDYPALPNEEQDRRMYQETKRVLAQHGYHRYEISNYAKKGFECRHNMLYWQRGAAHTANYAGFGLGAASTVRNRRWKNTSNLDAYLSAYLGEKVVDIKEDIELLSQKECMEEFMFLGLRMCRGVSQKEFYDTFHTGLRAVYGDVIDKWAKRGMVLQEGDAIRLTDAGIDISNQIFADFL